MWKYTFFKAHRTEDENMCIHFRMRRTPQYSSSCMISFSYTELTAYCFSSWDQFTALLSTPCTQICTVANVAKIKTERTLALLWRKYQTFFLFSLACNIYFVSIKYDRMSEVVSKYFIYCGFSKAGCWFWHKDEVSRWAEPCDAHWTKRFTVVNTLEAVDQDKHGTRGIGLGQLVTARDAI